MEAQKLLKRKTKAIKDNNSIALLSATINLAEYYLKESEYEKAIDEYKEAAKLNKSINNTMDYARCHRMIGEAYVNLRRFESALTHQQIHLQISKQEKNNLEEQRALATIGHIYLVSYLEGTSDQDKTPLNLAYKWFMKSLAICESLTDVNKTEHMDMCARLFANLGIVQESLGNFDKGVELIQKSIRICKAHDIYEQLQRGYTTLGALYGKMGNYSNAIHQYNLSVEVAGRLEDKVSLISAALLSKSELLIKLGDFNGAKAVLLKAYKMKNTSQIDRDIIENNLKTVAVMCYTESQLLTVPEDDYETRKNLYEKMGDGASELKFFSKAIEYYEKMLESAIKDGESGKDLSPAYISLAQTYLDNKQYDLAIQYFEKEFSVNQSNIKEAINTLFSIADAMKEAKKDFREIECIYEQAKEICRREGNVHFEGKVLSRHKILLEKNIDMAGSERLQKELEHLNYISSSEEDSDDAPQTPKIGDDINIEDITDISDDEEKESRATRKRKKAFSIKRNNKGETQLHTACISGNRMLVEKLLGQGHVVNVRDNCGWLPIHEACINGHLEIVRILIEKGAAINDRGGTLCNGMTPLHDAASNGHLEVIELLLDKGANVVSKTDNGETPFHILKRWRSNQTLDSVTNGICERILNRMSQVLEKSGQTDLNINNDFNLDNNSTQSKSIGCIRRVNIFESSEDSESSNHSIPDVLNAKNEYKEVMQCIRSRSLDNVKPMVNSVTKPLRRSALLSSEEVGDDWLEDDLASTSKKRKTSSGNIRRSYDKENRISDEDSSSRSSSDSIFTKSRVKRKRQSSLIQSGFTRKHSDSSISLKSGSSQGPSLKTKSQTKLLNFETSSIPDLILTTFPDNQKSPTKLYSSQTSNSEQTAFVDVRIMEKLYRVPIPYSEINILTIQWLAKEASKRYSRKECMKPILELQTKSGAILAEEDPINILFSMGNTQAEEILGNVLKWNLQSIDERYKESCEALGFGEDLTLLTILRETSSALNLSNKNFGSDTITPLCRALNKQTNLVHLDLSGNFSLKSGIPFLSSALPSLQNLRYLNLSNTDIDFNCLAVISRAFGETENSILENLLSLDLSHNPIGDEGLPYLAIITRNIKLKILLLKDVDFSSDIFEDITNKCVELYLDFLERFDISYNTLDKNDVMKFLSWVQPNFLEDLDISNNRISEPGLIMEVVCLFQTCDQINIKKINFTRCKVTDSEVFECLNILSKAPYVSDLNLSYNEQITGISLRRILQTESLLRNVTLIGCDNFKFYENLEQITAQNLRELTVTVDVENELNCHNLISIWKQYRNYNCRVIRNMSNLLQLTDL